MRDKVKAKPPKLNVSPASAIERVSFLTFRDLQQSIRDDVAFLREHPLVLEDTRIRGMIYNVDDHEINEVIHL